MTNGGESIQNIELAGTVIGPVMDVLVVDDNYMIRDIIGRAVKRLIPGCRCHTCACGQDALETIRRNHCHLAFLDLSMPDMTGFDLAREIRAGEKAAGNSPIPLVAISAFSPEQEWQSCQRDGFSAFLQKPFGRQDLKNCLASVLPALAENP